MNREYCTNILTRKGLNFLADSESALNRTKYCFWFPWRGLQLNSNFAAWEVEPLRSRSLVEPGNEKIEALPQACKISVKLWELITLRVMALR